MDLRKLKTILELFEQADIQELEISEGEEKLKLVKNPVAAAPTARPAETVYQVPPAPAPAPAPAAALQAAPEAKPAPADDEVEVTAQMVGTFYSSPSEGEPPFVKVGDQVTEGDTVCVIEAMKLFNNVAAPASGTIKRIVVQNEQPVGYGDVLMVIAPA